MFRKISRLLICAFACLQGLVLTAQVPRGKLVIIGGGSRPESIISRIILESGLRDGGFGIVLPMSSAEPDSSVYYAVAPFQKAGVKSIFGLNFRKGAAFDPVRVDSIRQARLIYITGGDQSRFMEIAGGSAISAAIAEAYRNGSVIAGTSAGAAVMCAVMITGNALRYPAYESTFETIESDNLETKAGLGLVQNVIIDQHFLRRSRHNRILTAVIDFPGMKGIGIDESTAILIAGNQAEILGESQVVVVDNPKKSRREKNGKLGARGLLTSIYLPGETFLLK